MTISADQIVIVILLIALLVKFIFFENHEDLADRLRNVSSETIKESNTIAVNTAPMEELVHNERVKIDIVQTEDKVTQTMSEMISDDTSLDEPKNILDESLIEEMDRPPRSLDECIAVFNSDSIVTLTDDELILIINNGGGICPLYKLETILGDYERAVQIRRKIFAQQAKVNMVKMSNLSYRKFDYTKVMNTCCENVLGYVEIPVGYAGPLKLDGQIYYVPMATTEGALVASTNRGCKALSIMGVSSFVEDVGMTRAPCVRFASIMRAAQAKTWVETPANFEKIKVAFDATSRFARLQDIQVAIDGPQLYLRFRALTGDAMGMNMISKGTEMSLRFIHEHFPDMQIISLSGNFCSDKKPAAINWIRGRGKRVVCECIIPKDKLRAIFKTDVKTLVQCNKLKNLSGSAMAGSIGGNNAHAANMVTAIFIATGQDPAQNVTSSNCSTGMEPHGDTGEDLYITCTMPSLEVGTVGGGTGLPGQSTCLEILGVRGAHPIKPAQNSQQLARIICATVMAGELSLMAALVNNELVKSHMRHNR